MFMVTKTITVTEEAYNTLKSDKEKDESFSQLILRTHKKKGDISEFIGAWKHIPDKIIDRMQRDIEERRHIPGIRREEVNRHFGK